MSVASRYLNRELLSVFGIVLLVLLLVAVGGRFIGYLQDAAVGRYNASSLLTLLGLRLPEIAALLLPFALFLAVLLTLGRFYAEQEMAVLLGGGAGPARLLLWLLPVFLLIASLVGWLSLYLTPSSNARLAEALVAERQDRDFANLTPGVFHVYARGDRVSYADAVSDDGEQLLEVFLGERQGGLASVTVRAERGSQFVDKKTGSRFLLLEQGARFEGQIGQRDYRVVAFERMGQRIEVDVATATRQELTALPTATLQTLRTTEAIAELGWRQSLPLLTLLTATLALGLARVKPRQGRFARMLPGLGVFLLYYLGLTLIQNRLLEGGWPTALGYWPVHGLFALLALYWLTRVGHPQRT